MKSQLILFAGLCLLVCSSALADGVVTQPYPIENIRYIEAGQAIRLDIRQGDNESLSVEGTHDILERVSITVQGERLILGVKRKKGGFFNWFGERNNDHARFVIELPQLASLELSGATHARLGAFDLADLKLEVSGASRVQAGKLTFDNLELWLSGASRIEFEGLQGDSLGARISGASRVEVRDEGQIHTLTLHVSGASHYQGTPVSMEQAVVDASGASRAELGRTEMLEINASGASNIDYRGEPRITQRTSGGSNIRSRGD
ncbi:GIN domain-containing protein [Marinimicrobium alkaliphilum]|uniref:GIN domain-containing protein n=1 Tax=Marinimicrobium alkaliphilum TaxID=2202654 RepID=UPI000DBAC434|nr:DUF2807 domain-containing protein [Marinimicrobium alkaliphilum]